MRLTFLKPSTGRLVLFAILMAALNLPLIAVAGGGAGQTLAGMPLGFFPRGTPDLFSEPASFSTARFIFNLIFWYVISSAIISVREDKTRAAFAKMALVLGGVALLLVISFGGYRYGDLKIALVVLGTAIFIGIQEGGRHSAV